jgi:hypothetical protein
MDSTNGRWITGPKDKVGRDEDDETMKNTKQSIK